MIERLFAAAPVQPESKLWLWRLLFHTRGLARDDAGSVTVVDRHVVAVRFLPDYTVAAPEPRLFLDTNKTVVL